MIESNATSFVKALIAVYHRMLFLPAISKDKRLSTLQTSLTKVSFLAVCSAVSFLASNRIYESTLQGTLL